MISTKTLRGRVAIAVPVLVGSLFAYTAAFAQSTGTQAAEVQELVVTAQRGPKVVATAIAESAPKSRSSINQEFIATQVPGQTVLDTINLLPGVNFNNNDAFGSAGGDITLRGFDSQRIALLQDGIPLNDTGNYAIYSNQQLDSELIDKVTVNLGTTDVDSPTAAAAGGTINYVTDKPKVDMGGALTLQAGTENFRRVFGRFDTGKVGPFGTTAYLTFASATNDLFKTEGGLKAPGGIDKKQVNGRIYQDLGGGDFISVMFNYNENRNNFIRRATLAQFNTNTVPVYDSSCIRPSASGAAGGTAQVDTTCSNFYRNNINPSNTGNIRGQSSFTLSDNLRLTVDPSFQYVMANGGGRTVFKETDAQLRTATDLNADGDTLDTVLLYWPNTTNTHRIGVTSSLIYKLTDHSNIRVAYTYDHGIHRQTGEATTFDSSGSPSDVFGGKDGFGRPIRLSDGTILRRRDRTSIADLNQFAVEYRGRYFSDRLLVNAGVRAPFFKRDLTNFCYQRDTFNAYCTTQTPGAADAAGLVSFPASNQNGSALNKYGTPRTFSREYNKVLPNLGLSYEFAENQTVYTSYAESISAPRTDDLYDQKLVSPKPESTTAIDIGYRYQTGTVVAAFAVFANSFENRIVRTFDEANGIFNSRNMGKVDLKGIDGQAGWEPFDGLSLYASASYIETEVKSNLPNGTGGVIIATKGKELVEVPKIQAGLRAQYKIGDFRFGLQGKRVGERWSNDVNTEKSPGYSLWDADIRYTLPQLGGAKSSLQLNIKNLLDEKYLGDIGTVQTGAASYQPGFPRAVVLTLRAEF
jgi:iron complex outermembrane receptor protein